MQGAGCHPTPPPPPPPPPSPANQSVPLDGSLDPLIVAGAITAKLPAANMTPSTSSTELWRGYGLLNLWSDPPMHKTHGGLRLRWTTSTDTHPTTAFPPVPAWPADEPKASAPRHGTPGGPLVDHLRVWLGSEGGRHWGPWLMWLTGARNEAPPQTVVFEPSAFNYFVMFVRLTI